MAQARYNARLQALLATRPDQLFVEEISYVDADLVPLDLLPNEDFERVLRTADSPEQQHRQATPVTLTDIVEQRQCETGVSFIVGPAGSGKSTLMQQLALLLAERGEEVPVLVTADLLGRALDPALMLSRESCLAILVRAIDPSLREGSETRKDLRDMCLSGGEAATLTLLVDGLDEVPDRDAILRGIADVQDIGDVPLRRVIISSRPGAFEALPASRTLFRAVLRVQPLDEERSGQLVRRLLGRWAVADDVAARAEEVGSSVFRGSPLLLYLLCGVAKSAGVVPRDVVALYDGIIGHLLQRGSARPMHGEPAPDQDRTLQLCRLVAYVVHSLGQSQRDLMVDRAAVRAVLTEVVEGAGGGRWAGELFPGNTSTASLLDGVLEGFSGLLCQQGRQGYVLLHRTLQEYMAASFLTFDAQRRPQWGPVRDFVVAGVEGEAAVARLPPFDLADDRYICSDWWAEVYRFAGLRQGPRWLGERMLRGEPSFREWLAGIRRHGIDRRDLAYRRLRHVVRACCRWDESRGRGEMEEVGCGRVVSGEADAHRAVGATLAAMLGSGLAHGLGVPVFRHVARSEWQTCTAADAVLLRAIVRLVEHGRPSGMDAIRLEAVMRHPRAAGAVVELMRHDKAAVRKEAAQTISTLHRQGALTPVPPGTVEALLRLLEDEDAGMRDTAMHTLSSLEFRTAMVSKHPGAAEAVVGLLGHGQAGVQCSAALAVRQLARGRTSDYPGVVEALVRLLEHTEPEVQMSAAAALGQLGEAVASRPGAVEALVKLLAHEDMRVLSSAASALGLLKEAAVSSQAGVVEALVRLLGHRQAATQCSGANALGWLGGASLSSHPEAVEALVKLLEHDAAKVRGSAAQALSQLGGAAVMSHARAFEALVKLLEHDKPELRRHAACAVGHMGGASQSGLMGVVNAAVWLAGHEDVEVSRSAACAVRELGGVAAPGDPGAKAALIGLLKHGDPEVRRRAADALGQLGRSSHPGLADELIGRLGHDQAEGKGGAAFALSGLGGQAVADHAAGVAALVKQLSSERAEARRSAAIALGRLEGAAVASHPGAVEALAQLLDLNEEARVQSAAACALTQLGTAVIASRPAVVEALIKLVEHGEAEAQASAAGTLGQLRSAAFERYPAAVEALVKLLDEHEKAEVQHCAASALGELGVAVVASHPGVLKKLTQLLEWGYTTARRGAAFALAKLASGQPEALEALVRLVEHDKRRIATRCEPWPAWAQEAAARGDQGLVQLYQSSRQMEEASWSVQESARFALGSLIDSSPSCLSMCPAAVTGPVAASPMEPAGPPALHAIDDFTPLGSLPGGNRGRNNSGMEVVTRRGDGAGPRFVRKRTAEYEMYDREVTRLEAIRSGQLDEGERALFCGLVSWHAHAEKYVLVLEHCEGGDLQALLQKRPTEAKLPTATVLRWAEGLARALDVMHRKLGRLHLDLKPANLLLTHADVASAEVKVADFGISQVCPVGPEGHWEGTVGHVEYPLLDHPHCAPEQAKDHHVSPATDRYQLGLVLLQLLCRRTLDDMEGLKQLLRSRRALVQEAENWYGEDWPPFENLLPRLQALWTPIGAEEARIELDRLPSRGEPLRQLVLDLLRAEPRDRPSDIVRRVRAVAREPL